MLQRYLFLLAAFISASFHPHRLTAQQSGIERLGTKQGLSQGFVSCIVQDAQGFIWAGTKNGLNRFDGYKFEAYTNDPYNEFSLPDDYVTCLYDHDDFLIVGTMWSGIAIYHKKTKRFYRLILEDPALNYPLTKCSVDWLAVDGNGNIWTNAVCPNEIKRVYKISVPPEFWKDPPKDNDWQKRIKIQTWPYEVCGRGHMLPGGKRMYIPTFQGIFEANAETGKWTGLLPAPALTKEKPVTFVTSDPDGNIWMVQQLFENGRHVSVIYKKRSQFFERPLEIFRVEDSRIGVKLLYVSGEFLWLGFEEVVRGYRIGENGAIDVRGQSSTGRTIETGNNSLIQDRSGVLWIGTNGKGILKINLISGNFQHYFPGASIYSSVCQDGAGNIIAYKNNSELTVQTADPAFYRTKFFSELESIWYAQPAKDSKGNFWITGHDKQKRDWLLKKIAPDGTSCNYPIPYKGTSRSAIVLDEKDHPWLAYGGLLWHFDAETQQFDTYDFLALLPEQHTIFSIARTADGSWWLASQQGLIRARPDGSSKPEKFDFTCFKNDPQSRNSLRSDHVASLLTDPNEPYILWIGTKGGGLNRLDTRTDRFSHITTREGLPDDVIYAVLAESGPAIPGTVLWMSSNKGLVRYRPANGDIKVYTEEDGLQADEFNTWACGKGLSGELFFGGVNGLTAFHPARLKRDTLAPATCINRISLNGEELSLTNSAGILTQSIEFTKEIEVPYSRNSLTLQFVALHFAAPVKNRFRYYLEGAETEWLHESTEHSATYLNLSPGRYVFRVKGSNSEGVWDETPAELRITVLPPWYRSWWAYFFYAAVLGVSALTFYRHQLNQRLKHAEIDRLKELDGFKTRFFTNITHEFRTPLTVILGLTEQLKARSGQAFENSVETIRRNGQNLLRLINQVLDLAKVESGKLELRLENADLIAFIRYIAESFLSYAEMGKVRLHFLTELEELPMDFDAEKMQVVLSNLLSNAVKFTPKGGHVYIQISRVIENSKPFCQIRVRDTGMGIPAEKIGQIFDRFYQVDTSETRNVEGTGIGLSLTKELVRLMQGQISVSSRSNSGATFTVSLPIASEAEPSGSLPAKPLPAPLSGRNIKQRPRFVAEESEKPLLLVVEDNEDVREYLVECVSPFYQVTEAQNGLQGIEKALELVPDLIVSDVMMPEKDGFELCRVLKNDVRSSHIPIVLLTARADIGSRMEGLTRGADEYIVKPFERQEFLIRLQNLIGNRRRTQSRYSSLPLPPLSEDPDLKPEDMFLSKIRDVVESHLADIDFEMAHLERALGMSRSQIFRKVKALTGLPPTLFIRSVRLHKSKDLLRSSKMTIAEIAFEVGFGTPSYFSTAFLEEFGKNPSDFRESHAT